MEIQFQKTVVPYLRTVMQGRQNGEETQQVRISDGMPDIGKVVSAWGQVLLRGKEWRNDSFSVSGGVKTWVLYVPEDGTKPQCVENWLPFQMKWDIPATEQDGQMIVCPGKPSVDARMLSDRKLMVRAAVTLDAWALTEEKVTIGLPEKADDNLQLLQNTYPMRLPAEAGEKTFELEESITLPMTEQTIEKIIRSTLEPKVTEYKLVGDKLVMRGTAHLHLLYIGTDGQIHNWGTDLPFSQFAQLDDQYGASAEAVICVAVTELETELAQDGILNVKSGYTAQYIIFDRKEISVVEDMYCPHRDVEMEMDELRLPALLDMQENTFRGEVDSKQLTGGILDVEFVADVPEISCTEDRTNVHLGGTFHLLGIDDAGNLTSEQTRWEDDWTLDVDGEYYLQMPPIGTMQIGAMTARVEFPALGITTQQKPICAVTVAKLNEPIQPDPDRPVLILRRADENTIWEIAKETGSTVEEIRKINHLEGEPEAHQMLLIPVP